MKYNVYVFKRLNINVMYILELNFYVVVSEDAIENYYVFNEKELLEYVSKHNEAYVDNIKRMCQNSIDNFNIKLHLEQGKHNEHTLCLHPSRRCNLNCSYCFREDDYLSKESLSIEMAKAAIDYFIDIYAPNSNQYVIDLSGSGEPLLGYGLIKPIIEYCDFRRDQLGKNIVVMFATNATCFTDEVVDFLDNCSLLVIGTSIDGNRDYNDKNRMYINKKGTYDDIVNGIKKFKNKRFGIATTITPFNQDVDVIYDHLYNVENSDCVSMRFLRQFDGSRYDFENFDVDYLLNAYDRLCENILKELSQNNFEYLRRLLLGSDCFGSYIKNAFAKRTIKTFRCDAGRERVAIDYKGDIYSCSVMMGHEDFKIGNIFTGMEENPKINYDIPNVDVSQKCSECFAKHICGGECYAVGFQKNHDPYTPYETMCRIKRELVKRSFALIEILRTQYTDQYSKLADFVFNTYKHHQSDVATWAVINLLHMYDLFPKYVDIISGFTSTSQGVHPQDVINTLNCYLHKFEAYQIHVQGDFDSIKLPAISLINKQKTQGFYYSIIEKIEGCNFCIRSIENTNPINIPISYYISNYSDIIISQRNYCDTKETSF